MSAIAVSVDELLGVSASVGFSPHLQRGRSSFPIAPLLFWRENCSLTRVYSGISVNTYIQLHLHEATARM